MRLSRTRMTHKAMHGGLRKARKLAAKLAETLADLIDDQGDAPIDPALLLLAIESADQVSRELIEVEVGAKFGVIQLELNFEPKRSKPDHTTLRECVSTYRLEVAERRLRDAAARIGLETRTEEEKPKKSKVDREIEEREKLAANVKDWFRQELPTDPPPAPAEPQGEPKAPYTGPKAWGESGLFTADGKRGAYEFNLWPESGNVESYQVTILCPDGETIDVHVAAGTVPPAEWAAGWIEAHEAQDKPPKRKRAS